VRGRKMLLILSTDAAGIDIHEGDVRTISVALAF
jgi:hypothetical protein